MYICSKLMEHILVRNIMTHLEEHDILYQWQHGFRSKRSTETQLLTFIHELSQNLDQKKQTDIAILDFSKAFDKVPHSRLALKLDYYGVRGNARNWISAFFLNRSQRVVLEGEASDTVQVTSGVPQGTVLGPILFLLYINDLPNGISSGVHLFADDAIVYRTISDPSDCQTLQEDLDKLSNWEKTWLMEFNASKCEVLTVTNKRSPIVTNYILHGQALKNVKSAKYLGVTIISNLKWNTHIDNIRATANKTLGFVKRNVRTRQTPIKTKAYQALVRPALEYCTCVWDPTKTKTLPYSPPGLPTISNQYQCF